MTDLASAVTANNTPAQKAKQRNKRVMDAAQLRQPDRVPIVMRFFGLLPELQQATSLDSTKTMNSLRKRLSERRCFFSPTCVRVYPVLRSRAGFLQTA